MENFILFASQQWPLIGALLVCAFMLMQYENRRAGATLTPQELVNLLNKDESTVVVDLRDKADFSKGHILNAVNVPFSKLDSEIDRVADKDKPVVLVCKLGQHSSTAGKKLAALGYSSVHRLKGGVSEWQHLQMPLVKS